MNTTNDLPDHLPEIAPPVLATERKPVDVVAVPKLIGKRTREGDRVFDGLMVFRVLHRVGEMLVMQPEDGSYYFYVRSINGGTQRFTEYQAALDAAVTPAVAAGALMARARRGEV